MVVQSYQKLKKIIFDKSFLVSYLLVLFLILLTFPFASAQSCSAMNSVCGGPLDSGLGFGAVEICGNCYVCGANDGFCPEDFYDSSNQLQGSCSYCSDPDCGANLTVSVKDNFNSPVSGADIEVSYISNSVSVSPKVSDANGESMFSIYSGKSITVMVSKSNYVTLSKTINLTRGEELNITFDDFAPAPCQPDCTRGDGRCHEDCVGPGGCFVHSNNANVSNSEIINLCNNQLTTSVFFVKNVENHFFYTACCSGPVSETTRPIIDINSYQNESVYSIETLVNHVQNVRMNGEQIFLVSTVFGAKE